MSFPFKHLPTSSAKLSLKENVRREKGEHFVMA
jgi:hypothetical protein